MVSSKRDNPRMMFPIFGQRDQTIFEVGERRTMEQGFMTGLDLLDGVLVVIWAFAGCS